jgi:UDPglucose--hexose-1-phosphate uridylyltransferase
MSELRQDGTSGAWVIIAPERGRRPRPRHHGDAAAAPAPPFDASCPFCPGNERLVPSIIEEVPGDNPSGWRLRVVPNKYPALRPEAGPAPLAGRTGMALPGHGHHEVIIETSRHNADLATIPDSDLSAVVRCYRRRFVELAARPGIKSVVVFRNRGAGGGASLAHPHSQVIATGMVSPRLLAATAWARSRAAGLDRCATCEVLERELDDGRRIVEATDRFVVIVPFAAVSPFEQWIVPRRHQASFAQIDEGELAAFDHLLQRALRRLGTALDDPAYNYAIESSVAGDTVSPFVHWRLRIVPDLVTPGGFELGAGLPINPALPEDDARVLRARGVTATAG